MSRPSPLPLFFAGPRLRRLAAVLPCVVALTGCLSSTAPQVPVSRGLVRPAPAGAWQLCELRSDGKESCQTIRIDYLGSNTGVARLADKTEYPFVAVPIQDKGFGLQVKMGADSYTYLVAQPDARGDLRLAAPDCPITPSLKVAMAMLLWRDEKFPFEDSGCKLRPTHPAMMDALFAAWLRFPGEWKPTAEFRLTAP